MSDDGPKFIKCVVCGDGAIGKTCMLMSYATNRFPTEYVPTVFDNYAVTVAIKDQQFQLGLFDTAGQEEYEGLRRLAYPGTHVFLLAFSVVMPESQRNLELKWLPEILQTLPPPAYLIVGTQADLREDEDIKQKLQKRRQKPITIEEGQRFAKRLDADCYVECSALTRQGLKDVFDEAMIAVLDPKKRRRPPKKRRLQCVIL
ncbi:cdc42 homolog [Mizuhopecten yessoensis]|uniref:Cell division control protein 42-like n=1 Tax=Mizuhopecten yessoensis TaxID=6573 RepID=A0A0N9HJP0_MIZYE|nr:cdc42 homolog [Mizuhopecten yessoensis]ALG00100.1 Rho GTPase [Mizuhopecten yessoensis]ALG00118.1 Rho GTPase [Mizuhopecten yessoensis]OWF37082.1 Cell division control protein 42-like [Mizuhopecten yessoensis]